ncbi:cytochrome oxidase biosynthesis protein [Idiomarina piscisalsi]|uniref:SURF1-like protein n=1 Tax=Idiomarina piscisalsi TaxID=1096243 RepID=A0ABN5AZJ3_9GAMM|nr:SURF1 family protein [Idiomarina piscisalsi]ASG66683.1 cytochrome oxidase biosynthesis protein [Idiomarina piscisalsi]
MTLKTTNIQIPLVATIITLLAIGVLVKLGFWQLERAEEKQQLFADYESQQTSEAKPLSSIKDLNEDQHRFTYVSVSGQFQSTPVLLLDNKILDSTVGYNVMGFFQPEARQLPIQLVNLGWIPAPKLRSDIPEIDLPKGNLTLTAYVYFPSQNELTQNSFEYATNNDSVRIQEASPNALSKEFNLTPRSHLLLLETPKDIGWQRDWEPQVMKPEKHYGYATQWFSLAVACLVIFVIAVIKLNKQSKKEEETQ